jgi:hypothetical protein
LLITITQPPQGVTADDSRAANAACAAIAETVRTLAKRIPLHTWLAALPQLISRVCHPCDDVREQARRIIERITQVRVHN